MSAVRPVAEQLAERMNLVCWDVAFEREAGRETVRVSVDREGGVESGELTAFSEALSRELDAVDAVPGEQRYWLEVTSPGAERKLATPEQFAVCRGRLARVTFRDGREPLVGEIADADASGVRLTTPEGETHVVYDEISQARLQVPGV